MMHDDFDAARLHAMKQRKNAKSFTGSVVRLLAAVIFGTRTIQCDAFCRSGLSRSRNPPLLLQDHEGLHYHSPSVWSRNDGTKAFMNQPYRWDGDDIRWTRKMQRRLSEAIRALQPAKATLVLSNFAFFLYQIINATQDIRRRHPSHWPQHALFIIGDTLSGALIAGPFTMDFVHSCALSRSQPHRYLTSGFLHGNLLHLLVNMDSLRRLPSWLETGLGWPLFVTAYLVSIITGNLGYTWLTQNSFDTSLCLGASGGICGLYGLLFSALAKMGNAQATSQVAKSMGFLLLSGLLFENISNAAHAGGFLGGVLVGLIFGPNYRKSYSLRRKWSLEVDEAPRGYRDVMGFGNVPTSSGTLPIQWLWIIAAIVVCALPKFRSIPGLILTGLVQPGSLTRSII